MCITCAFRISADSATVVYVAESQIDEQHELYLTCTSIPETTTAPTDECSINDKCENCRNQNGCGWCNNNNRACVEQVPLRVVVIQITGILKHARYRQAIVAQEKSSAQ